MCIPSWPLTSIWATSAVIWADRWILACCCSILRRNPDAARWGWQVMRRNPGVYARGTVRHSDHATITLPFWHRVNMNTETQSRTMANVAFLD